MENKKSNVVEETEATDVSEQEQNDTSSEEVNEELSLEQLKITELEKQVEEVNNRMLRAQADYDNFRRRSKEEKEAAAKYRAQTLVEELLPALDNFERALVVNSENEEVNSLLQGMQMVHRQLEDALKKEGVEVIATVGEVFDPHKHQAVMQVESEEFEPNHVVEELQKGYMLKDRVIRPAMVKVNA